MKKAYQAQRANAGQRGIGWQMTFKDWIIYWYASGKLEERGKGRAKYVMARHGDTGPYAYYNIKIITGKENCSEAHLGKRESMTSKENNRRGQLGRKHSYLTKMKMSASQKGKVFTQEHRVNLSIAQRKRFGTVRP